MKSGTIGHFVVVTGVSGTNVTVNDPLTGRARIIPRQEFYDKWHWKDNPDEVVGWWMAIP
jgi:predicted double-glycine peptidase